MLRDVGPALRDRDLEALEEIARRDDQIDILEAEILRYLGRIRQGMLTEEESGELERLMIAADNLENLADVIETDMVALSRQARDLPATTSEETRELLTGLYLTVIDAVELTVRAVHDNDQRAAGSVLQLKDAIRENADKLLARKARKLTADDDTYLALTRLQMAFVDQMRRIYTLTKRISKAFLPPVLAQRD
jgi:phosphate:Na+ symporter